jgi:hypothetical protein
MAEIINTALLVLENWTAEIFKASESYFLCEVPPTRFHLVARKVEGEEMVRMGAFHIFYSLP